MSLKFKETQFQTFLLYTHYRNTYQQGSKLLQSEHFKNREWMFQYSKVNCRPDYKLITVDVLRVLCVTKTAYLFVQSWFLYIILPNTYNAYFIFLYSHSLYFKIKIVETSYIVLCCCCFLAREFWWIKGETALEQLCYINAKQQTQLCLIEKA